MLKNIITSFAFRFAALGGSGMLMGATPDAQAQLPPLALTGNPALDAAIVAGVLLPGLGFAAWLAKTMIYAAGRASGAGLIAGADFVDKRANSTKETNDDLPASVGSAIARSLGGTLCEVFKKPPTE